MIEQGDVEDWSIQQIARLAGTTSRTLRHYGEVGLLAPTRIARNGYRHYDRAALVRLQRILLLRGLGLGLPQIAEVLDSASDAGGAAAQADALAVHLAGLRHEHERVGRQIIAVESTITALREGKQIMPESMFDGFDHTQHRDEVEQRWGAQAYADGDRWWRGMSETERAEWQQRVTDLQRDWIAAAESGADPASAQAQELAGRHVAWLRSTPGTPASALRQVRGPDPEVKGYVIGLGEMYVADPRFGANYATRAGGTTGAEFVRDALRLYAEREL